MAHARKNNGHTPTGAVVKQNATGLQQVAPITPGVTPVPAPMTPQDPALAAANILPVNTEQQRPLLVHDFKFLVGIMHPDEYAHLRQTEPNSTAIPNRKTCQDSWRNYNTNFQKLEKSDSRAMNGNHPATLPTEIQALADELASTETFKKSTDSFSSDIRYVKLANLIVHQQHIDLQHIERLRQDISPDMSQEEIFNFCFAHQHLRPSVTTTQQANTFSFISQSNDIRLLEQKLFAPSLFPEGDYGGTPINVVGVALGYCSNYLSAVSFNNRLFLMNGHHRAFALMQGGVAQAPCMIQRIQHQDELLLLGPMGQIIGTDAYKLGVRPPLLKDFLNDDVSEVIKMHNRLKRVKVTINYEEDFIPVA